MFGTIIYRNEFKILVILLAIKLPTSSATNPLTRKLFLEETNYCQTS